MITLKTFDTDRIMPFNMECMVTFPSIFVTANCISIQALSSPVSLVAFILDSSLLFCLSFKTLPFFLKSPGELFCRMSHDLDLCGCSSQLPQVHRFRWGRHPWCVLPLCHISLSHCPKFSHLLKVMSAGSFHCKGTFVTLFLCNNLQDDNLRLGPAPPFP